MPASRRVNRSVVTQWMKNCQAEDRDSKDLKGGRGGLAGSGRQVSGPRRQPALRHFLPCALPLPPSLTELLRETASHPRRRRGR